MQGSRFLATNGVVNRICAMRDAHCALRFSRRAYGSVDGRPRASLPAGRLVWTGLRPAKLRTPPPGTLASAESFLTAGVTANAVGPYPSGSTAFAGEEKHGPTAFGVGTLPARAVNALEPDRAVSVPRGGAFGRSKRLAAVSRGSQRVSPYATTSGMLSAQGATIQRPGSATAPQRSNRVACSHVRRRSRRTPRTARSPRRTACPSRSS